MKTVFIDTNVILDVILKNEGFWQDAIKVFRQAELGEIQAYISASSVTDIFYIASKRFSVPEAREAVRKLISLFSVVAVDVHDLNDALTLPILDMEDALQAVCAKKSKATTLITRDVDGFNGINWVRIVSPTTFLSESD